MPNNPLLTERSSCPPLGLLFQPPLFFFLFVCFPRCPAERFIFCCSVSPFFPSLRPLPRAWHGSNGSGPQTRCGAGRAGDLQTWETPPGGTARHRGRIHRLRERATLQAAGNPYGCSRESRNTLPCAPPAPKCSAPPPPPPPHSLPFDALFFFPLSPHQLFCLQIAGE